MALPAILETLASYIPTLILRRLATNPSPPVEPIGETFPAAVLSADMSGFTALTEYLAHHGPAGAEALSNIINDYFGQLIDLITSHGGDIVEFTGDGMIAVWPATLPEYTRSAGDGSTPLSHRAMGEAAWGEEDLAIAVHRAAQFGLAAQSALNGYVAEDGLSISLRIGIGMGDVFLATVGGVRGRWELLVAGEPLVQVSMAEQSAAPGDVVLSRQAWSVVHMYCIGQVLPNGTGAHVTALRTFRPLLPLPQITPTNEMDAAMRAYLPSAMFKRLDAGQTEWLAELRRVTVVFLNVVGIDYSAPRIVYRLHVIMRALQKSLYRYEGSVNQFIVDDKGTTLVAAFGLPPLTHEDDAVRGVEAALEMQARLHQLGLQCAIGVTSGWVFSGSRGNTQRCDYAMIGDVMNLAARLMQAAFETILCDEATFVSSQHLSAPSRLTFDTLPPIQVKGKAEPVPVYRPHLQAKPVVRPFMATIGRSSERALLLEQVERLIHCHTAASIAAAQDDSEQQEQRARAKVVIIEGEAGMGKSQLVHDLLQQAHALDVTTMVGPASAIEHDTPYHAWRPIFWHMFDLDTLPDDQTARRTHVLTQIATDPQIAPLAPLINSVLPLDIRDNEMTIQMTGQLRADNTHRLLLHLLQRMARHTPTLLVFESAHWMDSASHGLLVATSQRIGPLLIVIATRPAVLPGYATSTQLLNNPNAQRIVLTSLTADDIHALLRQRLGVQRVPQPVLDLILEKTEGNPLFSEELAYALYDTGLIEIEQGVCRIAPYAGDLHELPLPDSVQGVITSRVDRLLPGQQLTLKVASVIGHIFPFRILYDVYPIEQDKPALRDYLQALERLNIIARYSTEPEAVYHFKHVVIQETVYNLLLFAQRRELHGAVARWYEEQYSDDLSPYYALLAHHWNKAEVPSRTIDYLEKAGAHALRNYANNEAVNFLQQAIATAIISLQRHTDGALPERHPLFALSATPVLPAARQQARRYRLLSEAYLNLGQLSESRIRLMQALSLLGRPVPAAGMHMTAALLIQMGRQLLHRLWSGVFARCRREMHAIDLEMARVYSGLMTIHYFSNEIVPAIYASLSNVNLMERVKTMAIPGDQAELARAYANMCIIVGSISLHTLAGMYGRRARSLARQVAQGTTLPYVLNLTSLYDVGVGQWKRARHALRQAIDHCEHLGAQRLWGANAILLAQIDYYTGAFDQAAQWGRTLYTRARRNGDILQQAWALGAQGQSLLRLGRLDEAVEALEAAIVWLIESGEIPSQISNYGLLAVARLRQGDIQLARQTADTAARSIDSLAFPAVYYLIEGYAGTAEVYLKLWEAETMEHEMMQPGQPWLPSPSSLLYAQSREACVNLHIYARLFPIGQPRAWLWQGVYEWLSGHPRKAQQAWRKSLSAAQRLAMPYEQGLAHYEIGRHATAKERSKHLAQACNIFAQVGATYDLLKAQGFMYDSSEER